MLDDTHFTQQVRRLIAARTLLNTRLLEGSHSDPEPVLKLTERMHHTLRQVERIPDGTEELRTAVASLLAEAEQNLTPEEFQSLYENDNGKE